MPGLGISQLLVLVIGEEMTQITLLKKNIFEAFQETPKGLNINNHGRQPMDIHGRQLMNIHRYSPCVCD